MFLIRNKNISMASLVLAMLFSVSATAQSNDTDANNSNANNSNANNSNANNSNVVANLVIKVQELQDEVRMLHGQLEDQSIQLETLRQRQRDQFLDLDQRISGQRSPASTAIEPTVSGTVAGSDMRPENAELPALGSTGEGPAVRPPMDTPSDTMPLGVPDVQSQAMPANPAEEKAAYDQAFQALKDLRYADAAEGFQSFIARYPESEYADNAQYWLGESYYVTRNYDISLDAFNDLLQTYPDSSKKPDALLKIGYAHYELKQWDQARAALEQVKQQFPDTTLARLADNRLRSMRMEGHY